MVTEAHWEHWNYEKLLPYMDAVLEAFGAGRIMAGSDWPVCRLAGTYSEVMKLVRRFTDSMDKEDRARILYHNAADCYQLKLNDDGEEKVQGT
jgi:L-fuconolactonase